jgi:hypothetical protein
VIDKEKMPMRQELKSDNPVQTTQSRDWRTLRNSEWKFHGRMKGLKLIGVMSKRQRHNRQETDPFLAGSFPAP